MAAALSLASIALVSIVAPSSARAEGFGPARPLPGDLGVSLASGVEEESDIAAGAEHYLSVWTDTRTDLARIASTGGQALQKSDVFARRTLPDGTPVGTSFMVSGLPFEARRPHVAWNGVDAWLVIWEARRATQTTTYVGIRGMRVAADGTLLDDEPFTIDDMHGVNERFADVAGTGGQWMVAWEDFDLVANTPNLSGTLVAADGTVGTHRVLRNGTSGFTAPHNPSLAASADRFLATFHQGGSGSASLKGRFFDLALNPLTPSFGIGSQTSSAFPRAASNGVDFFVTWNGDFAAAVSSSGVVTPAGGRQLAIATSTNDALAPPCWVGDRWLVAGTNWNGHLLVEELDPLAQTISSAVLFDRTDRTRQAAIDSIGDRAVVAWAEDVVGFSDMVCAGVRSGPVSGGVQALGAGHHQQVQVDIDGNSEVGYSVVWLDVLSGATRVMFARLSPEGVPLDPEPQLVHEGAEYRISQPRVALGSTESVVVWSGEDAAGFPKIFAKRVAPSGVPIDSTPIQVLPGSMADVDFESGVYLVVGTHEPTNHYRPVIAARVTPSGTVLDPTPLVIGSSYARFPRVASEGNQFLVVWSSYPTHDSPYASTRATFVQPSGSSGLQLGVESAPNSTFGPQVAGGAGEFLITFGTDGDVWARVMLADGTLVGSGGGFHLTSAAQAQFGAAVTALDFGWVTAWTDYRDHPPLEAGLGDVYGNGLDENENVLHSDGTGIATGPFIEGAPAIAGSGESAIVAFVGWCDELQALRVHTARYATDLIGERVCSPAVSNSSGTFASVEAHGSLVAFANALTFELAGAPPLSFGYFLTSETAGFAAQPGGSQGNLCLGGQIARFAAFAFQTSTSGTTTFSPDLSSVPIGPGIPIFPGETWTFQAWFRDANPSVTSNFSDAITIRFQ